MFLVFFFFRPLCCSSFSTLNPASCSVQKDSINCQAVQYIVSLAIAWASHLQCFWDSQSKCIHFLYLCFQVHRLVIVDKEGHCIGVLSLSDILKFLVLRPLQGTCKYAVCSPFSFLCFFYFFSLFTPWLYLVVWFFISLFCRPFFCSFDSLSSSFNFFLFFLFDPYLLIASLPAFCLISVLFLYLCFLF